MNDLLSKLEKDCWRFKEIQEYLLPLGVVKGGQAYNLDKIRKVHSSKFTKDSFNRYLYINFCEQCIHKFDCKIISYTHRSKKNIIINRYLDEVEIIHFKQPLTCIDEFVNVDIDHSRNYFDLLGDGCLYPKDENLSNAKFLENMDNSARQSRDAFWGYALSNHWDYFITLTTDKLKVNRYDDQAVKHLWRLCRQRIQRFDNNAKILLVPERHEDFALHFHGLVAMENQWVLKPFKVMEKGVPVEKKSKLGAPLFEFPFWDFGFANCAIIYSDNDMMFKGEQLAKKVDENGNVRTTSQRRVVAYLDKYIGKQLGNIGYGQRSFYRTQNVLAKEKSVEFWNDEQVFEKCDMNTKLYRYKDNEKIVIYRTRFAGYDDENQ